MNGIENIIRMLTSAGLTVLGADNDFIYLEDPSCPVRAFKTFAEYAWIAVCVMTGFLLLAWGIAKIRGVKGDLKNNFKYLFLVCGIVSVTGPIMNLIYGGDLMGAGCKKVEISIAEVNSILTARAQAGEKEYALYEDIDIYDSGPKEENTVQPDISVVVDKLESVSNELDAELTAAEEAEKQAQQNSEDSDSGVLDAASQE